MAMAISLSPLSFIPVSCKKSEPADDLEYPSEDKNETGRHGVTALVF